MVQDIVRQLVFLVGLCIIVVKLLFYIKLPAGCEGVIALSGVGGSLSAVGWSISYYSAALAQK